jgi:hypothetical protein
MNKTFLFLSIGFLGASGLAQAAEKLTIFNAAATIPVSQAVAGHFDGNNFIDDKLVAKTLAGNDLINLALGRKLGSKVDPKTEVLALGVAIEGPGLVANAATRVIVYNPDVKDLTLTDSQRIKATIFTLQNLDFDGVTLSSSATVSKLAGQGISQVTVTATPNPPFDPNGDSSKNALFSTTLNGGGTVAATAAVVDGALTGFTFALKSVEGALHFKYLDAKGSQVEIDGTVNKGVFTSTGKPLKVLQLP